MDFIVIFIIIIIFFILRSEICSKEILEGFKNKLIVFAGPIFCWVSIISLLYMILFIFVSNY